MADSSRYLKQEMARLQEENRALREEVVSLREYIDGLQTLMEAVDQLKPDAEVMPMLDRILANALIVTNAKDGSLLVLDEERDELVFILSYGDVANDDLAGYRLPLDKGIAGWVARQQQPTIVDNAQSDARFYAGIDSAFDFKTSSLLAAPIVGGGRTLGVIEVLNKRNDASFTSTDQTLLTLLCRYAGEILNVMTLNEPPLVADQ
jgi:signal transduction protein with GAF and PtsI domain